MSVLMNTEIDKLSVMYEGDKNRDATDKIRGFLFQDYVTIMCLLQNKVKYVCSEYLEDVDVFFEDGTFEYIQVKYYPKKAPNVNEISTDLYYQYLRLQMLQSTLKAKPSLYIHRNSKVEKPTFDKMKAYIGHENELPKSVTYPNTADSAVWLRANVYSTNKKEEQKKNLFATMASEDSLDEFIAVFSLSLSRDTIFQDGESVIALENGGFTQSDFDLDKKEIKEKEKKVKELSDEIELLSKNNKMLKLLSSLSANKQAVIEYRDAAFKKNGVARCPVCGSESFSTMEEALILKEADEYITQNGEAVKVKEADRTLLQTEIEKLYQQLINRVKTVIEKETENLEYKIRDLKTLKNEIQPYFDEVKKLQKMQKIINVEELTAEDVGKLLVAVERGLLEESKEQEIKESYQQILAVLGYKFENETVQQTFAKVKNRITKSYDVSDFSYDLLVSKLNAIDSILANQTLSDMNQKLEEENKKNQKLDAEIEELQKLKDIASQRVKEIKAVVEKLSKDEYEKVGPALSKFYNKLIRINSSDGIKIVQKNEGISLVDDKDKNIVNVLSNGQLSVFMLAHFFAGINARNDREKMKVFFIDDLTACMDDVNMLAFMDLLKYQMSSKATMEQLFFITCDDRISKLLKYKLSGRGIALRELLETDIADHYCYER